MYRQDQEVINNIGINEKKKYIEMNFFLSFAPPRIDVDVELFSILHFHARSRSRPTFDSYNLSTFLELDININ